MKYNNRKPRISYLLARIYCLAAILTCNGSLFWKFTDHETIQLVLPMLVCGLPALFLLFSWLAFPFRYSVFGAYRRSTHPEEEQPECTAYFSGLRIGWFLQAFFTIRGYPSGIEISLWGVGKAFIPYEDIVEMRATWFGRYHLHHVNPEVRSPIVFSSRKLATYLADE